MEVVRILKVVIVVHQLILEKTLEEGVMLRTGQNQLNFGTDMIKYLKTNVKMHTVGNLMICQAHINVLMQIMKSNFVHDKRLFLYC